jgi:phosphoribosylformylglycinamidine synthase
VSGNVSLYNETDGRAILPTPTIGGVGLLGSLDEVIGGPAREGDLLVLVGETRGHLGQSALLAALGVEAGEAPPVDLEAERRNGELVLRCRPLIRAATDLGDGGLALAVFELAEAAGCGAVLEAGDLPTLFGEDQARYLLAVAEEDLAGLRAAAAEDAVPVTVVGRVGGTALGLGPEGAAMAELVALWAASFERAVA